MNKNANILFIFTLILSFPFPFQPLDNITLNNRINVNEKDSYSDINPSGTIIEENKENFSEGTMNKLRIDEDGYLGLETDATPIWELLSPKPRARDFHSMVYDNTHERVILFGGYDGTYYDETWIYNLTDKSWTNMNPSTKPSARQSHSMAYDTAHERVVLFGGNDGALDDETWVYNLTDNSWTNMNPPIKPSARQSHSMAYDTAHERMVLFGGNDGALDDETWVYNFTDNSWTSMNPSTTPSARQYHSMAYDAAHERVILFGGYNDVIRSDEIWVFSYCRYYEQGIFDSKLNSFDAIYKINGTINWTPVAQPLGTSLKVQIGFSQTTNEADFIYTALQNESFTFNGTCQYFKYRVNFESDSFRIESSLLNKTTISYTLEAISSKVDTKGDDDDDKKTSSEDLIVPILIGVVITCAVALSIVGIVLYSKKKANKTKN